MFIGLFRKIILFSAFLLLAVGGYFLFVSSEAPYFFLFGDLKNNSFTLFILGGVLIIVWIVTGIASKTRIEL